MLKNNNQGAVKRISSRSMSHNRIRNMFTVLAIVLTTFMFTTIFGIGFSLAKNMNVMLIRQNGTKADIFLMHPTEQQVAQVRECDYLNGAGVMIPVGNAYSTDDSKKDSLRIIMAWHDKEDFEKNLTPALSGIKGKYPEKADEIMLSDAGLEALGIGNAKIGDEVSLKIDDRTESFILTGLFKDYGFRTGNFDSFVSEEYARGKGLTPEKDGMLSISAKSFSKDKLMDELYEKVTLGEDEDFDTTYNESNDTLVIAAAILLICLIIIISGYLLIYNIMYISVTKDIRFFGMLKTIGTTPKQIRKIVRYQAFRLSIFGIPVGLGLGVLASFVVVPQALGMFGDTTMPTDISFNPFIYIATVLFALATVAISCRKPAKLAGKVSPVEALKFNGQNNTKIKPRKTTDGGKLTKMAYRNVFREKKRALLVFASLLMGTLALFSTQAFFGSMKLENYVQYYLPNDFVIHPQCQSDGEYEGEDNDPEKVQAAEKLAEDIKNIDGINTVMVNRSADLDLKFDREVFMPFFEDSASGGMFDDDELEAAVKKYEDGTLNYSSPVIAVDRKMMEEHNKKAKQKIDIDAFERGEVCLVQSLSDEEKAKSMKGKTITLIDPETEKTADIKVGVCTTNDDDHALEIGNYWMMPGAPSTILVSDSFMDSLTDDKAINVIVANCDSEVEPQVKAQIKELSENNLSVPSTAHIQIKSDQIEEFKSSMASMTYLTAGISGVLILIGIINFVNVMLTGVFTRRKELAVMESVGMTKKQIKKMLMLEGVYYGAIMTGLILTLGSGVMLLVAKMAQATADYAVFNYPWQLIVITCIVIMLICTAVPALVYGSMSKDSVTERLREN